MSNERRFIPVGGMVFRPSVWRGLAWLLAAAVLAGCATAERPAAKGRPTVAVSIPPQEWLVRQIAGDDVDLITLVGPADDHHTYQPSDAQVSEVMRADVYFRLGVPFESGPWFDAIRDAGLRIVDLRRGIKLRDMEAHVHHGADHDPSHDHDHGHDGHDAEGGDPLEADSERMGKDPHIWLTPQLLMTQLKTVAAALSDIQPERRSHYERNLAAAVERLEQLDAEIRQILTPMRGKAFFIFHPAWGYFADEYGLEQVAIEVEGKEPSDRELTAVLTRARREGVQVIFVQPQIAGQSARAVADTLSIRVEQLDPLATDIPQAILQAAQAIAGAYGPLAAEE